MVVVFLKAVTIILLACYGLLRYLSRKGNGSLGNRSWLELGFIEDEVRVRFGVCWRPC